ncbi:hypothetical protein JZ751_022032 [Albula glossodonta]|uniref:Uncharacterized protein n=1 Tax=Albula glossodonta TaxID=121402 RepID=A0A8T2NUS6_9TELE|nr:hypothetical protein JZ751_022032 [Albula glossodonta]
MREGGRSAKRRLILHDGFDAVLGRFLEPTFGDGRACMFPMADGVLHKSSRTSQVRGVFTDDYEDDLPRYTEHGKMTTAMSSVTPGYSTHHLTQKQQTPVWEERGSQSNAQAKTLLIEKCYIRDDGIIDLKKSKYKFDYILEGD